MVKFNDLVNNEHTSFGGSGHRKLAKALDESIAVYSPEEIENIIRPEISMVTASTDNISISTKGRGKLVVEQYNGSAYSTAEYWMTGKETLINITISKGKQIKLYGFVTELDCSSNEFTSLDVSHNPALTNLNCSSNQLTALDVSKNAALTNLNCGNNQLTALDVSKNAALTNLNCGRSQLTALDVSKNHSIRTISCVMNPLWASIDDVIAKLPKATDDGMFLTYCDYSGEMSFATWGLTDKQREMLGSKGWREENTYIPF